ncbi:TPA: DUF4387 domain-containing protein [Klebsiella pneumoniae]|nr:DUF4387 domain-containing protein [Klebsiella pneumoniae]
MVRIVNIAAVIRSKNSGPSELTLDIIFKSNALFIQAKDSGVFNASMIAGLYKKPVDDIISIVSFEPANAIKITMKRDVISGDASDSDIYGAQQHAPLLNIEFNNVEGEPYESF